MVQEAHSWQIPIIVSYKPLNSYILILCLNKENEARSNFLDFLGLILYHKLSDYWNFCK